jgi:hypothetical protein
MLAISSCASLQVKKPQDVKKPGKYLLYSLPEDVLVVRLLIEEKQFFKGPYADYAQEFLEIDHVRKANQTQYSLQRADISSFSMPDRDHYYYYKSRCSRFTEKVVTDEQQILCGFNCSRQKKNNYTTFSYLKNYDLPEILFPDACNDGTRKEVTDTTYKTTLIDSNFVKVPVLKKTIEAKTTADKAEEAANHLMRVRKRMFKFISGAYDNVPQPNTVEAIVNELTREEEEYLSLFAGKEYSNTFVVSLQLKPYADTSVIVAWFSEKAGLSAVQKPGYVPVMVEYTALDHLDSLKKYNPAADKKSVRGLIYRIPARTRVSLKMNNSLIMQKDMMISQKGMLTVYPASVLRKTKNGVALPPVSE